MRFVVLLFGFVGVLLTAGAGALFLFFQAVENMLKTDYDIVIPEWVTGSPMGTSLGDAGLFCFIAAGYGLLGTLMAFFRRGKQGAMLMLIPVLGAGFMNPLSFMFTGLLVVTALGSFFVGPLPLNAPKDDELETED